MSHEILDYFLSSKSCNFLQPFGGCYMYRHYKNVPKNTLFVPNLRLLAEQVFASVLNLEHKDALTKSERKIIFQDMKRYILPLQYFKIKICSYIRKSESSINAIIHTLFLI